jgi:hypothetical protein
MVSIIISRLQSSGLAGKRPVVGLAEFWLGTEFAIRSIKRRPVISGRLSASRAPS